MKRFSPEHVEAVAREFAASTIAQSWHLFGDEIRTALIDAHIMRGLRMAHVADSAATFTASEIIEFRDTVAGWLALGVKAKHSRHPKVCFKFNAGQE